MRNFNSHAPWGAWPNPIVDWNDENIISTHTLRGERDLDIDLSGDWYRPISTHTLRGERDQAIQFLTKIMWPFQLTRSVGSVTPPIAKLSAFPVISTHTLRGERDHAEI